MTARVCHVTDDFGTRDFHDEVYVWFGTTGGVDPKQVKAIYVDRVIFVKE